MIRVTLYEEDLRGATATARTNPLARALNRQQPVIGAEWHTGMRTAWLVIPGAGRSRGVPLPRELRWYLEAWRKGTPLDSGAIFRIPGSREHQARSIQPQS